MEEPLIITIRVIGDWNLSILNPKWMHDYLFELKDEKPMDIEFNEKLEPSFIVDQIKVEPRKDAIEIFIEKNDSSNRKLAIQTLQRLLFLLPHTPKLAIGFNYLFNYDNKISSIIEDSFNGFSFKSVKLSRDLKNFILNVIIQDNLENQSTILYNFHSKHLGVDLNDIIENHLEIIKLDKI